MPGAVTFQDREAMTKMSPASPVGTLAYVIEEEALLVRVNKGWQYIAVRLIALCSIIGKRIRTADIIFTTP